MLGGCGSNGAQDAVETSAVVVDMKQAQTGKLTLQNSFVGTVSPQEMVYVIPFASGTVTDTYFEVGDQVNAGDVLFKIDDSAAKLQLEQAQLSAANVRQQADSALTTQQESANIQMDSSRVQASPGMIRHRSRMSRRKMPMTRTMMIFQIRSTHAMQILHSWRMP